MYAVGRHFSNQNSSVKAKCFTDFLSVRKWSFNYSDTYSFNKRREKYLIYLIAVSNIAFGGFSYDLYCNPTIHNSGSARSWTCIDCRTVVGLP